VKRKRNTSLGLGVAALAVLAIAGAWLLYIALPRWVAPSAESAPEAASDLPEGRRIKATLFYVAEDGLHLAPVEREVPYEESAAGQARRILEAQLEPAPSPFAQAIPEGTKVRALYATERGEAFVDLSGELVSQHSGGSLDELLTVYAIVNAVTSNLPGISTVQILVDGREVDALAGHIDLRQPLGRNTKLVLEPAPAATPDAPPPAR